MRIFSAVLASLCVSPVLLPTAQAGPQNVDLKSSDGTILKATYFSPGKPGPGMVLFHQCSDGASRHLWDSFAKDLVSEGIHVITFDNRGFGETGGRSGRAALPPPPPPPSGGAPPEAGRWGVSPFSIADGLAALAYLKAQKGVDGARVAAGGSSCGAGDASNLAAESPDIKALLLLSGIPTFRALTHIKNTPSLAVFVAYAEQDMRDSPVQEIAPASKNPQTTVRAYPGTEHGVALLAKRPELRTTIVKWLASQLK
jgi:dienelactone hydrolase